MGCSLGIHTIPCVRGGGHPFHAQQVVGGLEERRRNAKSTQRSPSPPLRALQHHHEIRRNRTTFADPFGEQTYTSYTTTDYTPSPADVVRFGRSRRARHRIEGNLLHVRPHPFQTRSGLLSNVVSLSASQASGSKRGLLVSSSITQRRKQSTPSLGDGVVHCVWAQEAVPGRAVEGAGSAQKVARRNYW